MMQLLWIIVFAILTCDASTENVTLTTNNNDKGYSSETQIPSRNDTSESTLFTAATTENVTLTTNNNDKDYSSETQIPSKNDTSESTLFTDVIAENITLLPTYNEKYNNHTKGDKENVTLQVLNLFFLSISIVLGLLLLNYLISTLHRRRDFFLRCFHTIGRTLGFNRLFGNTTTTNTRRVTFQTCNVPSEDIALTNVNLLSDVTPHSDITSHSDVTSHSNVTAHSDVTSHLLVTTHVNPHPNVNPRSD